MSPREKPTPINVPTDKRQRWDEKIQFVRENAGKSLDPWDVEFIKSVASMRESGRDLSIRQSITLSRLFREVARRIG